MDVAVDDLNVEHNPGARRFEIHYQGLARRFLPQQVTKKKASDDNRSEDDPQACIE